MAQTFLNRNDRIESPGSFEESLDVEVLPSGADDQRGIGHPSNVRHAGPADTVNESVEQLILRAQAERGHGAHSQRAGGGPEKRIVIVGPDAGQYVPVEIEYGLVPLFRDENVRVIRAQIGGGARLRGSRAKPPSLERRDCAHEVFAGHEDVEVRHRAQAG